MNNMDINKLLAAISKMDKEELEKNIYKAKQILENSNIIITTINIVAKFTGEYMELLNKFCSDVIIDEAHHIAATSWNKFKNYMRNKRIVQFTATPFRNDNKKVDGKIIYNYYSVKPPLNQ